MIIEFDEKGDYQKAILMYRFVSDSGEEDQKYRTISVDSQVNRPQINSFLSKAKEFVKVKEKESNDDLQLLQKRN